MKYISIEKFNFHKIKNIFPLNKIYFNGGNSILIDSKTFFHWIEYISSLQTLTKGEKFDKILKTRTRTRTRITTTIKSILRLLKTASVILARGQKFRACCARVLQNLCIIYFSVRNGTI